MVEQYTMEIMNRANLLGAMNGYILDIGDEDIFDEWFAYGIPDGCDEELLMEIAEDKDEFCRICNYFAEILEGIVKYRKGV